MPRPAWPFLVPFLATFALGAGPDPSGQLDRDLDSAKEIYPVFVRMADQLIDRAGDHEKFIREHARAKRRALRTEVVRALHDRADRSWAKVAATAGSLEKSGGIADVERYWIVDGFACNASGEACRTLAGLPGVAFVYKERGPLRQSKKPEGERVPTRLRNITKKVLDDWKDDSDEPFSTRGLEVPWNLRAIGAQDAWEDEKATGRGVVVALIDTGLMVAPSLTRALWKNPKETLNGLDDDGNGYVDDLFGYDFGNRNYYNLGDEQENPHGSMCGGIIAGRPLNSRKLITGVAPRARLMVLRGMGFLKAYEYALTEGADVISMSYMWEDYDLGHYRGLYRTAHEHLSAAGVVAVGGAGNNSRLPRGRQIALPKDIPCVIATAGITRAGAKADLSSEGPCTWEGVKFFDDYPPKHPLAKPDLTAFFTGYPVWNRPDDHGGNWTIVSKEDDQMALVIGPGGNSFAGPHAAGVAALMLSANPDLPAWEVKARMEATARDLGPKGRDVTFGAGLIRAREAVRAARKPVD